MFKGSDNFVPGYLYMSNDAPFIKSGIKSGNAFFQYAVVSCSI